MVLSEKAAEELKLRIAKGEYARGSRIPNEFELAKSLNVSRNTVRDAVKLLISTNVLHIKRGKGTYVTQSPGLADDPLGLSFMDSTSLQPELEEVRLMFEPEIAYLAAQKATAEEIEQLTQIAIQMQRYIADYSESANNPKDDQDFLKKIMQMDFKFHSCLCAMSKNTIINHLFPYIIHSLFQIYESEGYRQSLRKPKRVNTHLRICDMLKANCNPDDIRTVVRQHILNSRFAGSKQSIYE